MIIFNSLLTALSTNIYILSFIPHYHSVQTPVIKNLQTCSLQEMFTAVSTMLFKTVSPKCWFIACIEPPNTKRMQNASTKLINHGSWQCHALYHLHRQYESFQAQFKVLVMTFSSLTAQSWGLYRQWYTHTAWHSYRVKNLSFWNVFWNKELWKLPKLQVASDRR